MKNAPDYAHKDINIFIITHFERPQKGNVSFYNGDLKELVIGLKKEEGKNIFCDGGAEIVNELLRDELIDEMIIFVIPVLLGAGTRLFQGNYPEQKLELISSKSYESGVVKFHYKKIEK